MSETWIGTTGREAGVTAVSAFFARWTRRVAVSMPTAARIALARVSLFALVMTCAVGCLDSPPQYKEPTRIPPQIMSNGVDPPLTSLHVFESPSIDFTIQLRADDAGQRLVSRFVVDLDGNRVLLDLVEIPPDPEGRPFELQDKQPNSPIPARSFTYTWLWMGTEAPGCHTLTAIISDQNNIRDSVTSLDPSQEARATWFLWLRDPMATDSQQPADCTTALQNAKNSRTAQ